MIIIQLVSSVDYFISVGFSSWFFSGRRAICHNKKTLWPEGESVFLFVLF